MQDFYEILQVHPKADQETIQAAYERMRKRYDPSLLEGAADELIDMARRKRDDLDHAYAVLSDAERRTDYDRELHTMQTAATPQPTADTHIGSEIDDLTEDDLLDYRPLPPANRTERNENFDSQPLLTAEQIIRERKRRSKRSSFLGTPAAVTAILTFVIGFASLLITKGGVPNFDHGAMMAQQTMQPQDEQGMAEQLTSQYEGQIVLARQAAKAAPENPNAWIGLGNTLYDSVQIIYEHMPDSEVYQELIPRWIQASEAYSQALALDPDNAVVRSDMAVSLCNYGTGINTPSYIEQGIEEARRASEQAPDNGRVLLNLGTCLISQNPPHTEEALNVWHKVLQLPDIEEGLMVQAQRLIAKHQPQTPSPESET